MTRLKQCRVMSGISQKEVSITLGVTQGSLSGWESGRFNPSYERLVKLANLYGVSVDYLLGNTDDETATSGTLSINEKHEKAEEIQDSIDKGETDILSGLTPENRKKALEYIKYLEFQQFSDQ